MVLTGLPPIVFDNSKLLILGTFPSKESLFKGEYYANPKNQFWDVLVRVLDNNWNNFDLACDKLSYNEKCILLKDNGLAIWDMIHTCERESNRDSDIKNPIFNTVSKFIIDNDIKKVLFNGEKAAKYFTANSNIKNEIQSHVLYSTSSTSPINTFQMLNQWKKYLTINA